MSIDKTRCCNTHTKEKEKSGECCQTSSEDRTYEHSPISLRIHGLAKSNPDLTYRELEKIKEQYGRMKK